MDIMVKNETQQNSNNGSIFVFCFVEKTFFPLLEQKKSNWY